MSSDEMSFDNFSRHRRQELRWRHDIQHNNTQHKGLVCNTQHKNTPYRVQSECRYADCRYAECRYAECRYAECRYAECRYAECRYAKCRYAECRGAVEVAQVYKEFLQTTIH